MARPGAFGILESFQLRDALNAGKEQFVEHSSVFRWSRVLLESFDSGYLKRIDYELARQLSPTARRLYRYLDKHFHPPQRMVLTLDLARLGYQHLGVSPGTALDKVRKRHIGPAAEELESAGYLAVTPPAERFQRIAREMDVHFPALWQAGRRPNQARVATPKSSSLASAGVAATKRQPLGSFSGILVNS